MSARRPRVSVLGGLWLAGLVPACRMAPDCPTATGAAVEWRHRVLWQGDAKVQSLAVGDLDPSREGLEVVGADAQGRVILVSRLAGEPETRVLYEHGAKLTGLLVADLDPRVQGAELYAGGQDRRSPAGVVVQIVLQGDEVATRVVWRGRGFVHALAGLPAVVAGGAPALVVTSYAGDVEVLRPGPALWQREALYKEPGDSEACKIKDVTAGRVGLDPEPAILVAAKSGHGVLLDRAGAEVLHTEPGGIARLALDAQGVVYLAGNEGRVVRLRQSATGWRATKLYDEGDRLRGIAVGRFRSSRGVATLAVFGYAGKCRLLVDRGGAIEALSVYDDRDKGHWLAAAELVPGNDSDELVCAGYSGRIVLVEAAERVERARGAERSPRVRGRTDSETESARSQRQHRRPR